MLSYHINQTISSCSLTSIIFMVTNVPRCLLQVTLVSLRPRLLISAWAMMQLSVLSFQLVRLCWRKFEHTDLCSVSWHRARDKPEHMLRSLVATKNVTECLPHRRFKFRSYTNLYFLCFTQKYIFPIVICCRTDYSLALFPDLKIAIQRLGSRCCGLPTWDMEGVQGIRHWPFTSVLPRSPRRRFQDIRPQLSFDLEYSDHRPSKASCRVHESWTSQSEWRGNYCPVGIASHHQFCVL